MALSRQTVAAALRCKAFRRVPTAVAAPTQRPLSASATQDSNVDELTSVSKWKSATVGKKSVLWDRMDSRQVSLLDQTMRPHLPPTYPVHPRDSKVGDIAQGTPIVAAAHLVYFPSHANEFQLSPDGYHADEAPPDPFCQRVWAGGLIEFNVANPLRVGELASQTKGIDDVSIKERSGADPLVLVKLALEMHNQNGLSVTEYRNLAYMKPVDLQRKTVRHNRQPEFSHELLPTEIMLFRYSALSWNSHRIHYDAVYARDTEHHPGLLVHGPLSCTLLLQLLQTHMPKGMTLKSFDYRAISPMYCQKQLVLNGRWIRDASGDKASEGAQRCELWATNNDGGLSMKGVATIVPLPDRQ
ncbi:hypothetical protein IWW55_003097 [Coemansia sp. RSA 2706]|nr:hypothetical protein LPJ63_001743 [Coemansia sp. RSA 2711]KAJ2303098.1 hypothetical protein IWW55_003097 [Coemansia sp. RSA 2706]KAJ2307919.1 hypothetical protein IWW54_004234 [Coemansia sp. RSA 2705]KAJ2315842.1 hypothetical protein IWW52_003953 [Coemansia sp. RSA 2704]KAJ2325598.1 hypothetical protein IWW51_002708 [Coemansia sp. RSA 2702]